MLFLSTILHWQPLFIVLAIRKMLYQNRIRLSISKTNKYLTILNLLFIIFMLCVALLLKQEAHTIFYIITISGIYFAVALLYADFLFKIVDKKLISQTQIILYIFVGLVVLEIVVRQGFFANIAPANDRRSEFFLGIIPFYSERIIVGGSGAAGYTIFLMIFGVISSGISNYKIRWSNFFIIGLLLYLSGSRTAMIVVPATISYFLILRVSPKIRWLVFFVSLIFLISFLYPYVTKAFVVGNTLAQRFQLFDLLISNVDYQMLLNGIGTSSINGKPIHNPLLAGFLLGGLACVFASLILTYSSLKSFRNFQFQMLPIYALGLVVWFLSPYILLLPFIYLMRVLSIGRA